MDQFSFDTISSLLLKRLRGETNTQEEAQIKSWLVGDPARQQLFEKINDPRQLQLLLQDYVQADAAMDQQLVAKIPALREAILASEGKITGTVHRVHFLKTAWLRYAAAILIIFGISAYLWNLSRNPQKETVATANPAPMEDIPAPASTRATLTLAGGQKIFLDSVSSGTLAKQGNIEIQKKADGGIIYDGKTDNGDIVYNTLTVPRGSQIASLLLADGTKVFLNAASSLTYPVAFVGKERRVEVTGEAYFEVAKDPRKKFIVTSGSLSTEVLGTHFNVNAYPDEQMIKVTLLEGSVKVKSSSQQLTIRPGEQAAFASEALTRMSSVNLEQVMAWKNGTFQFENASIESIMRQLSRAYDIDVKYEGTVNEKFGGGIPRNVNISQVLKMLQLTGKVNFRVENRIVTVTP